jgi:hypothetical protein
LGFQIFEPFYCCINRISRDTILVHIRCNFVKLLHFSIHH